MIVFELYLVFDAAGRYLRSWETQQQALAAARGEAIAGGHADVQQILIGDKDYYIKTCRVYADGRTEKLWEAEET